MKHHAFTNDERRDPDFFIAGRLQDVVKKWAVLTALQLVLPLVVWIPSARDQLRARLRSPLTDSQSPYEMTRQLRVNLIGVVALAVFAIAGYFPEALMLWWLPARLGFLLIMLLFAWLPHHPHGNTTRYGNARVTLFPLSTLFLRGQNHHVLHHMFPRVPHYSLPRLFGELRPRLEAEGTRIEGSGAGPGAPPVGLRGRPPSQSSVVPG
jgi:beta-carotene hydroxylase